VAEESELVGGISVELSASDTKLASDLAAAERLVQEAVRQMSAQATVTLNAQVRTPAGGAAGGGGGAIDYTQLANAISTGVAGAIQSVPRGGGGGGRNQGTPVSFGAFGSVRGGTLENLPADFQRQINEALGTGEQQAVEGVRQVQTRVAQQVERAPVESIPVSVSAESLTAELASLTAELKTWREQAEQLLTLPSPTTRRRGGGGGAAGATVAEEGDEEGGTIGFQTRQAAFELREGQSHEARVQQTRRTAAQRAYADSERARHGELDNIERFYNEAERIVTRHFDRESSRIGDFYERQASIPTHPSPNNNLLMESSAVTYVPARDDVRRPPTTRANLSPEARAARLSAASERVAEARRVREAAADREFNLREDPLTDAAVRESLRGRSISEAQRERRIQQNIERQRAGITAAGQTGRTAASGLGALFFGTRGAGIEARSEQAAAERELTEAERAALPIRRRLAELDEQAADAGSEAERRRYQQAAGVLRRSEVTQAVFAREEEGVRRLEAADTRLRKLEGFGSIARNLTAVAAGSAVFSAALRAVDVVVSAIVPSLAAFVDEQTGFAATSTRVTSALAQQTAAMHGNVDATLAQAEAQAGVSAEAATYLNTQLRLTTQVKAGALAQQQASDLFRAAAGAGGPQGLFGGFGGIAGTSLLGTQLGGGKGFTETVFGDLLNVNRPKEGGTDLGALLGQGLSYLGSEEFRTGIDALGKAQGQKTPLEEVFPFSSTVLGGLGDLVFRGGQPEQQPGAASGTTGQDQINEVAQNYLDSLNSAIDRGGGAPGQFTFTADVEQRRLGAAAAATAGDLAGAAAAAQGFIIAVNGAAGSAEQYQQTVQAAAVGVSKPDVDTLRRENNAAREALVRSAERQQQFTLGTQLPAQAALRNLANPPAPVGTGIKAANADEQSRIEKGQQRTIALQTQLNSYYAQGRQILQETYQIPPALISSIRSIGQEIASIQAGIRNDQAAYQVAQYNFQLRIARRTLADIGGLTGKNFGAGQSYLGILERQNLALSRQAQLLQFALAQRQINFQVAVAGFQVPGVTPEERQANVKAAQIEADYAQKQLDIQRKIFGNQVQIVDIQNLRQGADLAAQIQLLLQGRQVTIDTALAEEKLLRLQALQQEQVAQASTYLTKIDNLAAAAFSEIQALETAAVRALGSAAEQVIRQYGIVIRSITSQLNAATASLSGASFSQYAIYGGGGNAQGYVGTTSGPTLTGAGWMGEAGTEAYAILRNPKPILSGGAGGGTYVVQFSGDIHVRSEDDIDKIARKVEQAMGRKASAIGMRSIG